MNRELLEDNPDAELEVYVVWSPQLGAEERHVREAAELVPDSRATHVWDPGRLVGEAFANVVGTSQPAWDVWLLFHRDSEWPESGVPDPAWWEHQLDGLDPERHLDPRRFAKRARRLLRRPKAPESGPPAADRGRPEPAGPRHRGSR